MKKAHIFNHTVNVIGLIKDNKQIGMTCAWSMCVDNDKILLLLGSQSYTAHQLEKDDVIGVSTLAKNQKDIASFIGNTHSDSINKFTYVDCSITNDAILINNSYMQLIVKVIDVMHLELIEEDYLIYAQIMWQKDFDNEPLQMNDFD